MKAVDPVGPLQASTEPATRADLLRAFDELRARMDGGAEQYDYASVRRRLIQFFRLHFPQHAVELADLTLARIARRVEGLLISSFPAYALSIARMVVYETRSRETRREEVARAKGIPLAVEDDIGDAEATDAMSGKPSDELLLAYFGANERVRGMRRASLAVSQGVSQQVLRARSLRAREALERSMSMRGQHDSATPDTLPARMSLVAPPGRE
jgi:hypothetical protein